MTPLEAVTRDYRVLGDERVMSLRTGSPGHAVDRHDGGGLKKLTADGRIEAIPVKAGDPHATSAAGIMTIDESRSGQIWIGTLGGGVNVLDPATGAIRQLPFGNGEPGAVSAAEVTSIAEDSHGNLWIGTMRRPESGACRRPRSQGVPATSLTIRARCPPTRCMRSIVDAQDRVWVATEGGGLSQVVGSSTAPQAIRFKTLMREQGLTSDTLYGIVPDDAGSLWLSGNAGLMRFDPASQRGQGLPPRAWLAGRGVCVWRLLSPARWSRVLRRSGRLQHLRSGAPDARIASRRAWR